MIWLIQQKIEGFKVVNLKIELGDYLSFFLSCNSEEAAGLQEGEPSQAPHYCGIAAEL